MQKTIAKPLALLLGLIGIELAFICLLAVSLHEYLYPTLAAIILVYLSIPAIELLEKHCHLPRTLAVGIIFAIQLCIILLIFFKALPLVIIELSGIIKTLPKHIMHILNKINTFAAKHHIELNIETSSIEQKVYGFFQNLAKLDMNAIQRTFAFAQGTANQLYFTLSWIINCLLVPILFLFIGIHYDEIITGIEKYTPIRYRANLSNLLQEINHIMSSFLRGELLLISSLAVCYITGFHVAGVPYATGLGILTGLLSFIPIIGSLTGMIIATFSLYSTTGSIYSLAILGIVYTITGTLESLVFIPYFIGSSLGMSTFTSLIILIIATKELGGIGLILGIPIAAIIKHIFLSFAAICREHKVI